MRHYLRQSGKARGIDPGEDRSPLRAIEILHWFQIGQKLLPRKERTGKTHRLCPESQISAGEDSSPQDLAPYTTAEQVHCFGAGQWNGRHSPRRKRWTDI